MGKHKSRKQKKNRQQENMGKKEADIRIQKSKSPTNH